MISKEFNFEAGKIDLFKPNGMLEIEKCIEKIFQKNEEILPKKKSAKILIKPNFNNDLNALTGNSTDLRIILSVIKSLKNREYTKIIIGEGSNCGINHIGIDVFKRIGIDKICKEYGVRLVNFNKDSSKNIKLFSGEVKCAKTILDADFVINLPKIKTHVEAGMSCSCKNYMGALIGTQKRKMHDNLHRNIVSLNESINTDLIIADGLIGMEGRGPGDGIPKKLGVILSGTNVFLMDFFVTRIIGLDYSKIPFLKISKKLKKISEKDIEEIQNIKIIKRFQSGEKSIFDRILLNNFFIGIRFSKKFEKFFNSGILPWILYQMGVKQDKYVLQDREINNVSTKVELSEKDKLRIKKCLAEYCPIKLRSVGAEGCIKCLYCYQILPKKIEIDGKLNDFEMQMDRFNPKLQQSLYEDQNER